MDVLAVILTCSLHDDDALVRAIADNARGNPFSVVSPELDFDAASIARPPASREAAVARLRDLTDHGEQALVGLMQAPVAWAAAFGREPEDLLDPCVNVSIATAMLSEFDYACRRASSGGSGPALASSRRSCVLRRYAEALHLPELTTVVTLGLRYQRGPAPQPSDAPIFPPPREQTWGSTSLFVQDGTRTPSSEIPTSETQGRSDRPSSGL